MKTTRLPIGIKDFKELITDNYIFVDKSDFIREIIEAPKVNIITRPQAFGKTLNLSMLRYYFERPYPPCVQHLLDEPQEYFRLMASAGNLNAHAMVTEENAKLFDDLTIANWVDYQKYMHRYPVISISLDDIGKGPFDMCMKRLAEIMSREFERHDYLLSNNNDTFEMDRKDFTQILNRTASPFVLQSSLYLLIRMLHKFHNEKVVVLVDDYDKPLQQAFTGGHYDELKNFLQVFFETAFRDNSIIFRGVVCGNLLIPDETILGGFDSFQADTLLNDTMDKSFGFTESEMKELLDKCMLEWLQEPMSHWFGGFISGRGDLFHPKSVISCLQNSDHDLKVYTLKDNSIIKELLQMCPFSTIEIIKSLLEGDHLVSGLKEFVDLKRGCQSMENLFSVLFHLGYLSVETDFDRSNDVELHHRLKITNLESIQVIAQIL